MTDNTTLNPGTAGDVIRTLDRTGTGAPKTEVVQLDLGGGDGFAEALAQAQIPVRLLDSEWPVDDDGVPLVNLSAGNAADAPTGTLQQQILNALLANPIQANPPFQLGKVSATGAAAAPVFKTNGASSALIYGYGTYTGAQFQVFGSIDGKTTQLIPWVLAAGPGTVGTIGAINSSSALAAFSNVTFWIYVTCAGLNFVGFQLTALTTGSMDVLFQPLTTPSPAFAGGVVISDPNSGQNLSVASISGQGTAPVSVSGVGGVAVSTAASGVQLVGIEGHAGAAIDGATGAVPPANALQIAFLAASANPSNATAGRQTQPFCDLAGRLVTTAVNPRSLIKTTAFAVSVATSSTLVAAQGANIFADITMIVITTAGLAAQTITISDGTLSWIIDYPNAAVAPGQPLVIDFGDVPLPATTANTAWTVTQSLATTCHYLVVFANKLA